MEVGEEGDYNQSLHCHHQNGSCIKMGSDESHFNVVLIVRDKVTRHCPQTTNLFEEKGEPKRNRTEVLASAYQPNNALPLGQTGSQISFYIPFQVIGPVTFLRFTAPFINAAL